MTTTFTPEEIETHRAEWVTALRGNRYPQGRGRLRNDVGYCCLGVAEDVRGCEWIRFMSTGPWVVPIAGQINGTSHSFLTPDAMNWYGVTLNDPFVLTTSGTIQTLSKLNDYQVSFTRIADAIAAQPASWDGTYVECVARRNDNRRRSE